MSAGVAPPSGWGERRRCERLDERDWREASRSVVKVSELFFSIQGEGSRAGLPSTFLRLSGCRLRCRWCDTTYAFGPGRSESLAQLETQILTQGAARVCITGGEPLLQRNVVPLVDRLIAHHGLDVAVETGGDQDVSILPREAAIILDVKLPGSGMQQRMDPENLARIGSADEVKLVVCDREDYEVARDLIRGRLRGFPGGILMSAVHGELEAGTLADWILADRLDLRLQIQLHKHLWPGAERGV